MTEKKTDDEKVPEAKSNLPPPIDTHEVDPNYDYNTGRAFKRNKRGELVEDRGDNSGIAKGTDFDLFTGKE